MSDAVNRSVPKLWPCYNALRADGVSHQDYDEPASRLLERFQADREAKPSQPVCRWPPSASTEEGRQVRTPLPINLDALLRQRAIEGERVEYKAGWNPERALHTICAFANDFHNLGGGYLVIGVEEASGRPVLPPKGIDPERVESMQKELLRLGHQAIQPAFNPLSAAIEEAIVNAAYHRSYEEREPVEVRISPEDLVVLSFPGPDRSVRMDDLRAGRAVSRRYRNRRIGEFLKELDLTEGRSTGVPKILRAMKSNGSPPPEFESDGDRTYFLIRLPVHERAERGAPQVTPQVTPHVTPHVERLLAAIDGEHHRDELLERLGLTDRKHFRTQFLAPAMAAGLVEMTDPDSPRSRQQRYRLTDLGRRWQAELPARGPDQTERAPE